MALAEGDGQPEGPLDRCWLANDPRSDLRAKEVVVRSLALRFPPIVIGLTAGWALQYFVPIWLHSAAEVLVGAPL